MSIVDLSCLDFAGAIVEKCKEELKAIRWIDGFCCPACGHKKSYQLKSRNLLECANKKCKRQTSPTAQTQFHNTRSLEKFWVILSEFRYNLKALTKKKIRELMKVSASTACRIANIISSSFKSEPNASSPGTLRSVTEEGKIAFQDRQKADSALRADTCQQTSIRDNDFEPPLLLLIQLKWGAVGAALKCKNQFLFSRSRLNL